MGGLTHTINIRMRYLDFRGEVSVFKWCGEDEVEEGVRYQRSKALDVLTHFASVLFFLCISWAISSTSPCDIIEFFLDMASAKVTASCQVLCQLQGDRWMHFQVLDNHLTCPHVGYPRIVHISCRRWHIEICFPPAGWQAGMGVGTAGSGWNWNHKLW